MKMMIQIWVALFLFYAPAALSCNFDTDCGIDSSCVVPKGEETGYCLDNNIPEEEAKEKSIRKRLDVRGKSGKSCTSDRECGLGNRCLRRAGRLRGSCE
ncbi:MAG: hypothetical protein AAF431_16195 [Pseudomonadota bacterium]